MYSSRHSKTDQTAIGTVTRGLCHQLVTKDGGTDFGMDSVGSDDKVALDSLTTFEGHDALIAINRTDSAARADHSWLPWSIFGRSKTL